MRDAELTLRDGRTLAYSEIGRPGWPSVFFFHGAPSSRLRLAYLEEAFLAEGVRVISPDRPGYGRSSPSPDRSLADWAADVTALADELRLDQFAVAGHSSGGPYAAACGALLPERVWAGIVLGGVTDMAWPAAWDGYLRDEVELMRMPEDMAIRACIDRFGEDGSRFLSATGWVIPEPDLRLYEDEATSRLLSVARAEAFRQGIIGYAQDLAVQGRPWPFDPATIRAPFHVLHGEMDTLVPLAHSRHTASRIPRASLEILSGHGHFTVLNELPVRIATMARAD
ncbi:MAG TPA: alpha/beta hydrolase [Longimicrobiales bacterium]|nr:alpha/beta hydrolase [Longimicrobiales bacterium]